MFNNHPEQWLFLKRTVRFGDTDAAGVMHFHQILRWCHEAWEESLDCYGLPACDVFPANAHKTEVPKVALPIVYCQAEFQKPLYTGDELVVELQPERIDASSFQVQTKFLRGIDQVALGLLRHVAINSQTRKRCNLSEGIDLWLEASSLGFGPKPL